MNATMTVAHNQMKKYGIIIVVVTQILVSCCFLALFVSSLVVPDPLRSSYFDVTNALMVFFITTEFNLAAHLLFAKYNNISILLIPFLVYNVAAVSLELILLVLFSLTDTLNAASFYYPEFFLGKEWIVIIVLIAKNLLQQYTIVINYKAFNEPDPSSTPSSPGILTFFESIYHSFMG